MKSYGIGGLGVDERVFSALDLKFDLIPLQWIAPKPKESFQNYAIRFAEQIDTTESFLIIGVSFGGMLALELSKILRPQKIILISSATQKSDIPFVFRLSGKLGLHKLIPNALLKPPSFLVNHVFGVREPLHRKILHEIIADTDIIFLRWAIHEIVNWEHVEWPTNLIRIHGSSDRLLKYSKKEQVIELQGAGHFMIIDRAKELSQLLNQELRNL